MRKTEMRNPKTMHLDTMTIMEMLEVMNAENMNAVKAVEAELEHIEKAVEIISTAISKGGRLIYMGAGTSGRLGVLDASECPPTFGVSPETVVGIIAGGDKCLRFASEGAEDDAKAGIQDISALSLTPQDVLVGISVAGAAAYILSAIEYAKECGCKTVGLTSNADSPLAKITDVAICTDTGAEVLTGSTRLKAGTAHKLVLNMLSTCSMVQQGYVYENLMINLKPTNTKLKDRVIRIVSDITALPYSEATLLLEENEWNIRNAIQAFQSDKQLR